MNKKLDRKKMLSLYRKLLTQVLKRPDSLGILKTNCFIEKGRCGSTDFGLTIFTDDHENCTFNFYDFYTESDIIKGISCLCKILKTDDFVEIESLSKDVLHDGWGNCEEVFDNE